MPENDQLLKAVLDRPNDDTPRLAYAHWCEGQIDETIKARADFIRLQVQLRAIFSDRNNPNRFRLYRITSEQAGRYGRQWAGPLAGLVEGYVFFGGFVELVTLPAAKFVELAPKIFSLAPIVHLNLTGTHGFMTEIFALPWLKQIRSMALDDGHLTDADMEPLAQSPHLGNLRWLSLADNQLELPGLRTLALAKTLSGVRYIHFAGNPVDPGEQYAGDQGVILSSWLPKDGKLLEQEVGPIPWLHPAAEMLQDLPPNRFAI